MFLENPTAVMEAAGAAGYVAGMAVDTLAVRRAARRTAPVNETWGLALEGAAGIGEPSYAARAARWSGRVLLSELALVGAVAAGINAYAWTPIEHSSGIKQAPPTLEIVVDHSGATGLQIGDQKTPVVDEINKVVEQFSDAGQIKAEAIVAGSGTQASLRVDQVPANQPFGSGDLAVATSLALTRTAQVQPIMNNGKLDANAAVLVLTNGNEIGKVQSVVAEARQKYGPTSIETPVFIVNVEGAKAGEKVANDLKAVATETGATYWSADKDNLDSVSKSVKSTITATEEKTNGGPDKTPFKVLGGLLVVALANSFRRRGNKPIGRGLKG